MKTMTITTTWKSVQNVDVPDDFELPDTLDEFPEEVLEQLDALGASLTDWE